MSITSLINNKPVPSISGLHVFKQAFCIEPYLLRLEQKYKIYIAKFRLCNIRIPIETGRWQKITRENRKCTKCSKDVIGDEYHYLFICNNTEIQRLRSKILYTK